MNPTLRVHHENIRTVNGFDVIIKSLETMEYDGVWVSAGFDIYLGLKKIGHFWGYPISKDIQKLLDIETGKK
jgi:hypothetical protein